MILVATYNAPWRLRHRGLAGDMQRLADQGVAVIATQENTDRQPSMLLPDGWRAWRPPRARSAAIMWDPDVVDATRAGWFRLHSGRPYRGGVRYAVWVHLRTPDGPLRFASIHLPAWKTSVPRNAREFRHQQRRAATWLSRGPWRVIAGDINAELPSRTWAPDLSHAGRPSEPVPSGPHGTRVDYVIPNRYGRWCPGPTTTMRGRSDHQAVLVQLHRRR